LVLLGSLLGSSVGPSWPLQVSRGSRPRGEGIPLLRSVGFRPPTKIRRRRSIPYAAWFSGPLTGFFSIRLDLGMEHRPWASWAFLEASPMDLWPIASVRSGRSDVILLGKPRFRAFWRPFSAVLDRMEPRRRLRRSWGFLWALAGLAGIGRCPGGRSWPDPDCLKRVRIQPRTHG
jgi:hypothetical protein